MPHPYDWLPPPRRAWIFVPLLVLTLATMIALVVVGRPLETPAAPSGIVSFEFAGDVATARRMIESWSPLARMHAALSLGLDYLYLCLYSTTIGWACVWAADGLRGRAWPGAGVGRPLAGALWGAALCDATENAALLTLLLGSPADPWPQVAWIAAAIKFSLVGIGLLYALYGFMGWARTRGRSASSPRPR
jgi:hypothetical protein